MGALIFYFSTGIQICIAMSDINSSNFPNILNEIIEKSLFTPRQIEIIFKYNNSEFIEDIRKELINNYRDINVAINSNNMKVIITENFKSWQIEKNILVFNVSKF